MRVHLDMHVTFFTLIYLHSLRVICVLLALGYGITRNDSMTIVVIERYSEGFGMYTLVKCIQTWFFLIVLKIPFPVSVL